MISMKYLQFFFKNVLHILGEKKNYFIFLDELKSFDPTLSDRPTLKV